MIGKVIGHIQENNGNKYLVFDSVDENKKVLKKYTELWGGIKNKTEIINGGKTSEYGKDFMKIKFDSDDDLQLNKQLKFPTMTIVVRSVFEDECKFYPQVYLDEFLYALWMLKYNRIDISKGIDASKTNASKECDICHYWYFKDIGFMYEPYLCNGYHDLMQTAISFNDVAIVFAKGNAYRIHFWYMSKNDVIIIMNNSN